MGRVLPGASDRLKTFSQSPAGPESEISACHQSHSIRCQGHVPKIQSGEKTRGWLSSFPGQTSGVPLNPTRPSHTRPASQASAGGRFLP